MAAVSDAQPVPHVCPGTPGPCTASTPRTEPKTKKKTVYNLKFKKEVVDYAELKGNNHEAARFYKLPKSWIPLLKLGTRFLPKS